MPRLLDRVEGTTVWSDEAAAWQPRLPTFPGGGLPAPEPRWRTLAVRAVALAALAFSVVYLIWRATATLNLDAWWVSLPFFALECHAVLSLALFTFSLWDLNALPPAPPVGETDDRIAVLIPTYNEGREILLPTIAAAVALQPAHETWVLDDGDRPWLAELAAELGARYLTRPDRAHAKAGNINHALGFIDADIIAVLDADHVATPRLLTRTLGYFADPHVALVQTPQDFYNLDSFEHERAGSAEEADERRDRYHEQALFYRAIQPGKNRWGAAFCCGTGAIIRMAALREIGGFATETITEDIHTTIRLHRRGWKTVYHNEVLSRGLAASTAEQFQLQRFRWGAGAMQVLRQENPLLVSGLRPTQRLAYAATLLGWFECWRSLGYLLLPGIVVLTGALPVLADARDFLIMFGITFCLQQIALQALSRGYGRPVLPIVFELVRMTPNMLATLTLFRGARAQFRVTPKGRLGDQRRRMSVPTPLNVVSALSAVAAVWFTLVVTGIVPFQYVAPWAAYGAFFWLVVNSCLMAAAMSRIRAIRYGAERRTSVRFPTGLVGALADLPCHIHDISLTGALISVSGDIAARLPADASLPLTINLGQTTLRLGIVVRSRRLDRANRLRLGLEFLPGQQSAQARLALALFNAQIVPDLVEQQPHAA